MLQYETIWKQGEVVQPITIPFDLLGNEIYLGGFGLAIKDGNWVCAHQRTITLPTIAPRRGSTAQIQALRLLRVTCGVICVSLQLCILTVTLATETGAESTVCSWVKSLGAMPEQWKARF
jgi:hypothetical protein